VVMLDVMVFQVDQAFGKFLIKIILLNNFGYSRGPPGEVGPPGPPGRDGM
jgi:hypothetical protein